MCGNVCCTHGFTRKLQETKCFCVHNFDYVEIIAFYQVTGTFTVVLHMPDISANIFRITR